MGCETDESNKAGKIVLGASQEVVFEAGWRKIEKMAANQQIFKGNMPDEKANLKGIFSISRGMKGNILRREEIGNP